MSRFSKNLFCVAPDEEFICTICMDVFDDPLELPCRHMFCRQCLNSYGELTCPLCRHRYEKKSRKAPPVVFQNLLRKLKMKCENRLCSTTVTLEDYWSHQLKCDFASVGCPIENCTQEVHRKDLKLHKENCEYRRVICPHGCGVTLPHREIDDHYYNNCSKGVRLCQKCDVMYNYEERAGHNCVELLKEENKSLKAEISSLKAKMQEKDNRIRHLKQQTESGPSSGVTLLTQATAASPGLSASAALTTSPGQDKTPTAGKLLNTLKLDVDILDLLLLADGMLLVATYSPEKLMLYDLSGTQLQTMSMNGPCLLCKDGDGTVFVLDCGNSQLKCLEVDKKDIKVKDTCRLSTEKHYYAITALDKTLAVSHDQGVDLINSAGVALKTFATDSPVGYMCTLQNGDLICDFNANIERWNPKTGKRLFQTKVPEIPDPIGVVSLPSRTILVCGGRQGTLSLIDERGNLIRHLYKSPSGGEVSQVSVQDDTCVLKIHKGRRYSVQVIYLVY